MDHHDVDRDWIFGVVRTEARWACGGELDEEQDEGSDEVTCA